MICLAEAPIYLARPSGTGYDLLDRDCDALRRGYELVVISSAWGVSLLGRGYEFLRGNDDLLGRAICLVGVLVCLAGAMICLERARELVDGL